MAIKLEDIAKSAHVSPATVSLALNGKEGVGEKTREKILKIAKELNYEKKKIQNLTKTSVENGTILFLRIAQHGHTLNRDHDIFIADYIDGLTEAATSYGLNLEINSFRGIGVPKILESIEPSKIKGIIVLGTELTHDDFRSFETLEIPLAFIDTFQNYLQFDFIDMNNKDGIYKMVEHLIQNGHTKIGFLRSTVKTRNFRIRDEAFHEIMSSFSMEVDPQNIITVDSTFDGAYQDMYHYLEGSPTLPESLVCTNDIMAYGCIKACDEYGIKVPEDLSFVGFDDLPLSTMMTPPLTTIKVSKHEIGMTAIRLIHNRINGNPDAPPVKVLIGGELITRKSVRSKK